MFKIYRERECVSDEGRQCYSLWILVDQAEAAIHRINLSKERAVFVFAISSVLFALRYMALLTLSLLQPDRQACSCSMHRSLSLSSNYI